jgi:hypothetical protein
LTVFQNISDVFHFIQADFPSTPSAVYSNRILEQNKDANGGAATEEDRSSEAPTATSGASATTTASTNNDDHSSGASIDQATKSFQQMYVNAPVSIVHFDLHYSIILISS